MIHSRSIIIGLAILVAFSVSLSAGVPSAINYQGLLTDGSGNPVPDNSYSVQFSIYDAAIGGVVKWTETQSINTSSGLFAVLFGSSNPIEDTVFNAPSRFLGIKVGADSELSPRTMLVTVPWSFRVATVDGALGGTISGDVDVTGKANIGVGNSNTGAGSFVAGANSDANGIWAVVSGGNSNIADGDQSTVGGGADNTATGTESVIAGGSENTASGSQASVGGGSLNFAAGGSSIVAGGADNNAGGFGSTVSGGINNVAGDSSATVGGGRFNFARGKYSVVAGGGGATQADSNSAQGDYSTVAGGIKNVTNGPYASIGGGASNKSSYLSVVGGGNYNTAEGSLSTIGGGGSNSTSSWGNATIGGGGLNETTGIYSSIAGGKSNQAYHYSTVGGGLNNTANGSQATIPGGELNYTSGDHSFAAGFRAKSYHDGAFVWADNSQSDFTSGGDKSFSIRASGGTRIFSDATLTSGVLLAAGGSSWSAVSDSSLKRNIREVDYSEVLNKVADLPISQWSYESQDESIEHVGPMAQDFYELFGLGEDDKHINTLDPDGIALAAIKALHNQNQMLKDELAKLKKRLDKIENQ